MRVLLVEDEVPLAEMVRRGLVAEGYAVQVTHDGSPGSPPPAPAATTSWCSTSCCPGSRATGCWSGCARHGNWTPVLMLTAKDGEYDEADAFDLGADDYLVKPFSFVVLLARLRNLLRRAGDARPTVLQVGTCGWTPPGTACTAATPRSP